MHYYSFTLKLSNSSHVEMDTGLIPLHQQAHNLVKSTWETSSSQPKEMRHVITKGHRTRKEQKDSSLKKANASQSLSS
eukprot:13031546-Ditylum_brightwellii.AAC.1